MMVRAMLAGTVVAGVAMMFTAAPVHAWDCSLPENSGVAECPVLTTTTSVPATSTSTQPVTTSTVPVTSSTVDETTSSTGMMRIDTAVSTATPTSVVVGAVSRASRELPRTGNRDLTGPLLVGLAMFVAGFGLVWGAHRRSQRT